MQVLYELDFQPRDAEDVVRERLAGVTLNEENRQFVTDLVHGVLHHREEIDARIATAAPQWPIDQIAHVDKNVLRLAIYELMFDNSAPAKVAISEGIELARLFGSAASPKFVNGVLGAVAEALPNDDSSRRSDMAGKEVK